MKISVLHPALGSHHSIGALLGPVPERTPVACKLSCICVTSPKLAIGYRPNPTPTTYNHKTTSKQFCQDYKK